MASSERDCKAGDIVEQKASDIITLDQFDIFWERLYGESILYSISNQALVLQLRESIRKYLSDVDNYPALLKQKLAYQLNLLANETKYDASKTFLLNLSSDIKAGGILLKKMITREIGENESLIQALDKKHREKLQSQQSDGSKGFDIKLKSGRNMKFYNDVKVKKKLIREGVVHFKEKNFELSEVFFKRALQYFSIHSNHMLIYIDTCLCLFKLYFEKEDFEQADYYNEMAKLCLFNLKKDHLRNKDKIKANDYLMQVISGKILQGNQLHSENKFTEAKICFMSAFDCFTHILRGKEINALTIVVVNHFSLLYTRAAETEIQLGNFVTASSYLIRSLRLIEERVAIILLTADLSEQRIQDELHRFKNIAMICIKNLRNIGFHYWNKNAYKNAETEFREAIEWQKKLPEKEAEYYADLIELQYHLLDALWEQNKLGETGKLYFEIEENIRLHYGVSREKAQYDFNANMRIEKEKWLEKIAKKIPEMKNENEKRNQQKLFADGIKQLKQQTKNGLLDSTSDDKDEKSAQRPSGP